MNRHGVRLAAFIADSLFSSDGIRPDPAGFLKPVVDAVREAGGLYIATRSSPASAAPGRPCGASSATASFPTWPSWASPWATACRSPASPPGRILEEFGHKIRYFNTFGGNSVCVAAAAAVLDVIETEGLLQNARVVGRYLRDTLTGIAETTPRIGAVRGRPLRRGRLRRARHRRARWRRRDPRVNGLRERHVLISATGPDGSTLKIRPPLPFTRPHVDQLAEALSATLSDLDRNT